MTTPQPENTSREPGTNVIFEGDGLPRLVKETTTWDIYNNEARKVDNELVKDWTATLNFLLLFAAIFAAVLTAFIIESKRLLEPDYSEAMYEAVVFYMGNVANGTIKPYSRAEFAPSFTAVSINCLFFGSLCASLVAALASVVALQWVADFDALVTRGGSSPQDRAKRRQFRFTGVKNWQMGEIIAALPLFIYFSVGLFFLGVIQWMLYLHTIVAYVVIGGAAVALFFYFSSTLLAVLFVSAPYKTPLSRWIYSASYLPFTLLHWALVAIRLEHVPSWIATRRQGHLNAYRREDLAVEKRTDLDRQAMDWLARQVSISDDARHRLTLLVGDLVRWDAVQLDFKEFSESPWISILDFLYFAPTYRSLKYATTNLGREHSSYSRGLSGFIDSRFRRNRPGVVLSHDEVRAFKRVWDTFDTEKTGYIISKQIDSFLLKLSGIFQVRIYPASHRVPILLEASQISPSDLLVASQTRVGSLGLRKLKESLSELNWEEIERRRRVQNRVFWEARLIARKDEGKISFLRMMALLGYNKVFERDKVDEIDEHIRGRAFADELKKVMRKDMVRRLLLMAYHRRRFHNLLEERRSRQRSTDSPEIGVPLSLQDGEAEWQQRQHNADRTREDEPARMRERRPRLRPLRRFSPRVAGVSGTGVQQNEEVEAEWPWSV